jgi:hypothetical protein
MDVNGFLMKAIIIPIKARIPCKNSIPEPGSIYA